MSSRPQGKRHKFGSCRVEENKPRHSVCVFGLVEVWHASAPPPHRLAITLSGSSLSLSLSLLARSGEKKPRETSSSTAGSGGEITRTLRQSDEQLAGKLRTERVALLSQARSLPLASLSLDVYIYIYIYIYIQPLSTLASFRSLLFTKHLHYANIHSRTRTNLPRNGHFFFFRFFFFSPPTGYANLAGSNYTS